MPGMRSASASGPDDGAAGRLLQAQVAAGVVAVVVGDEEVGETPALGGEALQDFFRVGSVDRGREPASASCMQHAVVVGETGKLLDLELRHALALLSLAWQCLAARGADPSGAIRR